MSWSISTRIAMAACLLCVSSAKAAVLGNYEFTGTGTAGDTSVPTAPNVTFGSFTRVNVNSANVDNQFGSGAWTTGGTRNVNEYVQFVVTPAAGFSLNVEQMTFQVQDVAVLGFLPGPANGQVSIFRNSDLVNAVATQAFTPTTTQSTVTFNFADFNSGVGQGVTVRFYGWNGGGLGFGQMNFDNVAFSATVVPEPVNVALGVFGVCAVGLGVSRRIRLRGRSLVARSSAQCRMSNSGSLSSRAGGFIWD